MNNTKTPNSMNSMTEKEWQSSNTRFSTQMSLLMKTGLTYDQASVEYHCLWKKLNPKIRKKLKNITRSEYATIQPIISRDGKKRYEMAQSV